MAKVHVAKKSPTQSELYLKEQITDGEMYYILLNEIQLWGEFGAALNSLIRVENVDVYTSNQLVLSSTQAKNGVRIIPLTSQLKEFLKPFTAYENVVFVRCFMSSKAEREHSMGNCTYISIPLPQEAD